MNYLPHGLFPHPSVSSTQEGRKGKEAARSQPSGQTNQTPLLPETYFTISTHDGFQVTKWQRTRLPVQETQETQVQSPGGEEPLEEEMATHSSILVWRIPQMEEPGGLQPWGHKRVRHNRTCIHIHTHTHTHTHKTPMLK